jgi:hypothetical protein
MVTWQRSFVVEPKVRSSGYQFYWRLSLKSPSNSPEENEYCAPIWYQVEQDYTLTNLSCGDLGNISNSLGCCLETVLPIETAVNLTHSFGICNISIPAACPIPTETIAVQFGLTIPYSWTVNHTVELTQSIQTDFSITLAVSPQQVVPTFSPDLTTVVPTTLVNATIVLNSQVTTTVQAETTISQSIGTMFTTTQAVYSQDYPGQTISVYGVVVGSTGTTGSTTESVISGQTTLFVHFAVIIAITLAMII